MTFRGHQVLLVLAAGAVLAAPGTAVAQAREDPFSSATIVSASPGTVQPGAMFDGSVQDPGSVTFFPARGVGTHSEAVFDTVPLTLDGIKVHAANDGPEYGFRRAMSRFQLFSDRDGDGTMNSGEQVVDRAVDIRYGGGGPIELSIDFPMPVTARRWKVVVTQGTAVGGYDGVRISELDAVPTKPRSTTLTVVPVVNDLLSLRARLTETATGAPVPGRTVTMATSAGTACSAATDSDGVASCSGAAALVGILLENGYTASFAGDSRFLPASARAGLLTGATSSSPGPVTARPPSAQAPTPTTQGVPVVPSTTPQASLPPPSRPVAQAPTPPTSGPADVAPTPRTTVPAELPRGSRMGRPESPRSAFVDSVLPPSEVALAPALVVENLALAAGLVLLVAFPAELFNATALANYEEIARWRVVAWSAGLRERLGRVPDAIKVPAFATVGALLYAQLSPDFGFDRPSAALFAGMLLALVVLALIHDVSRAGYARWFGVPSEVRTQPLLILLALVLAVVSRAAELQPGYVYGLFTAVAFLGPVDVRLEGRSAAFASVALGSLALAGWLAWEPVRQAAGRPGAGFAVLLLDSFLASFWVAALGTVVFGLVPVRFLVGEQVRRWSALGWVAIYGLVLTLFLQTVAHPERGFYSRADVPLPVVLVPFFAFGLFSVAFWAYFRARGRTPAASPTARPF